MLGRPSLLAVAAAAVTAAAALVGAGPTLASDPPSVCGLAGRGVSTFARINVAELEKFFASRSDIQPRVVNFNATAAPSPLPSFQTALNMCLAGDPTHPPADAVIEITSATRPAWVSTAASHPEVEFINVRASPPANPPANTHWYIPEEFRASYLKGFVAGLRSRTGHVGLEIPFDDSAPFVQQSNAFFLGLKKANPSATLSLISTQTFNETITGAQPPTPPDGIHPMDFFTCRNPLSDFPAGANSAPIDCLAFNKMLAADSSVDVVSHLKSSFYPQWYVLGALTPSQPDDHPVVENQVSYTMSQADFDTLLSDQRVLTSTVFDFQPLLHRVIDQYLSTGLVPASTELVMEEPTGHIVDVTPPSGTQLTRKQRKAVQKLRHKIIRKSAKKHNDPLCGDAAEATLGEVYTFVHGCQTQQDRITGLAYAPGIPAQNRLRCVPQVNPDPQPAYPVRCTP